MKKFIFVSLLTLLLAFSANAYSAEDGWYVGGYFGPVLLDDPSDVMTISEADIEDIIGEDVPEGTTASVGLEYDIGFTLNVAPGYDFGAFRLECELAYQISEFDKENVTVTIPGEGTESVGVEFGGDVTSLSVLFNGYYDFLEGSAFRPYITAGVGQARLDVQVEGDSGDDSALAYQFGAGVSYDMSENVTLDFRYRYFATADVDFYGLEIENTGHSVLFGVRYSF
jgi:opacity protein-like surface antigen